MRRPMIFISEGKGDERSGAEEGRKERRRAEGSKEGRGRGMRDVGADVERTLSMVEGSGRPGRRATTHRSLGAKRAIIGVALW